MAALKHAQPIINPIIGARWTIKSTSTSLASRFSPRRGRAGSCGPEVAWPHRAGSERVVDAGACHACNWPGLFGERWLTERPTEEGGTARSAAIAGTRRTVADDETATSRFRPRLPSILHPQRLAPRVKVAAATTARLGRRPIHAQDTCAQLVLLGFPTTRVPV